jgi:diadenosine tetraphosphate (Ap4A) HIT family hydrolase
MRVYENPAKVRRFRTRVVSMRLRVSTPILREGEHWFVTPNLNQNFLGKCMIVLSRDEELVTSVTADEWVELRELLAWTTERLRAAFAPDHFNYAFLQNMDRHVHMHVVPRYGSPRDFAGERFIDGDWPDHYRVPGVVRQLTPALMAELARVLVVAGE